MATFPRIFLIFCLLRVIYAWGVPLHANILTGNDEIDGPYDYVIVGGGTAGLAVGDRLSADGKYSVLVIEYGVLDNSSAILTGGVLAGRDPSREFSFQSVPQAGLSNRSIEVVVGKLVGGSSGINGLQALRGTKEEYDLWAQLGGGPTWKWEELIPYFKKAMHFIPPLDYLANDFNITWDMDAWGQNIDTKVFAGYPNYLAPSLKFLYQGMATMPGVDIPKDGNFGATGLYFWPNTMNPSTYSRSYARTGHWDGINRPNYSLLVGSKVIKVESDGNRATGVSFVSSINNGSTQVRTVEARKEVILAAGTIHTPQILELSGIGSPKVLSAAGIPVKVNLPGVGENLQDHSIFYGLGYKWGIQPPTPIVNGSGNPNTTLSMNCGAVVGLPAITSQERAAALARDFDAQDTGQYLPQDAHTHILAGYRAQKKALSGIFQSKNTAWMWLILGAPLSFNPINQHPLSRGNVHINASNPHGEPIVDYRALSNPIDLEIMIEMLRFIRKYAANDLFAPYNLTEGSPGLNVTDSAELGEWIRARYSPSSYHPVGTAAKMPRELGGVVDEELRVYGVKDLRVVDASIMPIIPGAPTVLTTYAIAEKAADLIKKRA